MQAQVKRPCQHATWNGYLTLYIIEADLAEACDVGLLRGTLVGWGDEVEPRQRVQVGGARVPRPPVPLKAPAQKKTTMQRERLVQKEKIILLMHIHGAPRDMLIRRRNKIRVNSPSRTTPASRTLVQEYRMICEELTFAARRDTPS